MLTVLQLLGEKGRATEWLTSLVMIAFALTMALSESALRGPGFAVLRALGFDSVTLASGLAVIGAMRLTALYINGALRRSPSLRMWGAIAGSATFGALASAFFWPWWSGNAPLSTAAGTYLVLAFFDALAAYRSGADVRLSLAAR